MGENNSFSLSPLSLLHSSPSITVCGMYKRNLRAAEVVGDLAFPPGPAGVAFKINSVSKSEERYRREEREDVRKEGENEQTAKRTRGIRTGGENRRRTAEPVQRERDSVSASMCSNKV